MGNALEQNPHWQEAPRHMVTFTKGFYLSDHPITNAEYAAVTGDTNCNPKNYPDDAAVNISCAMFDKYVKALLCQGDFSKDHIHANGGADDFPVNELLNDNRGVGRDLGGHAAQPLQAHPATYPGGGVT